MVEILRFDVFLVSLDPTEGFEINKTRPCLIISPNEMNKYLKTIIIAPMTTKGKLYPTRVSINFNEKNGQIILDQIRTIDKQRLVKKLGTIELNDGLEVLKILQKIFAYQ